jgi:hypothetical protein
MFNEAAVFSADGSGVAASDYSTLAQFARRLAALEGRSSVSNDLPLSDPFLERWVTNAAADNASTFTRGTIVLSLPFFHIYLVKCGDREPPVLAAAGTSGSLLPIGVRNGETLRVGSTVLMWRTKTSYLSYIVSVLPDPGMQTPDYIQQGGRSSIRKDPGYRAIANATTSGVGAAPQTSGRPIDGRQGDYSLFAETGVGVFIDSFQAFMRINEVCGLWLNYFGNHAKLSGCDLDVLSYAQHQMARLDEGELQNFVGHVTYPNEAVGCLDSATAPFITHDESKVQLDTEFAQASIEPVHADQTPVYRVQEYSGYLGHGYQRFVVKPGSQPAYEG